MAIVRPYRRTCRQFTNGGYAQGGRSRYILHPLYAKAPEHYVRAFLLAQKDLQELFDYVEPADSNLPCHSYRIHELLLRSCVEVEANCKAILTENQYAGAGRWNTNDYRKIDRTHHLSSYEVKLPTWHGAQGRRKPFAAWAGTGSLPWYDAYNATKHDRHEAFSHATFEHMIDAVCGLLVVLSAQFHTDDFSGASSYLCVSGPSDGMETAIGGYLRIKFPTDWPDEDKYEFDWTTLAALADPFQSLTF